MSLSMRPEFVASATRAAVIVRSHFSSGHVGPSVLVHCASSDIPPSDSDSGRTSLRQVLHTHWGNRGEAVLKPLGGRLWASWGPLGNLLGILGGILGPPGCFFGRKARLPILGPSGCRLEALLGCLGRPLGRFDGILGRLGAVLGASWAVLRLSWGPQWPFWSVGSSNRR